MIKYIIGIDPSLSNTGVSVLKQTTNTLTVVKAFNIETKKSDINTRIIEISQKIVKELREYQNKDTTVVIEDPAYFKLNMNTFKKLNMLLGAILYALNEVLDNLRTITPSEWQSFLKVNTKGNKRIKRKEIKQETKKLIENITNKTSLDKLVKEENIIDAISISVYYVIKGEKR